MLYDKIRRTIPIFLFAHRGAPYLYHENSIQSISEAIHRGCHGVEIDIQITHDNQIILFHDDFIFYDNKKYMISSISYKKLKNICQKNQVTEPDLFSELIPIMINNSNIVFNIEIKSLKIMNSKILDYIFTHIPRTILHNQCIISSFNYFLLFQIRFLFFYRGPVAFILSEFKSTQQLRIKINKILIFILNPQFLHISFNNINESFIEWIHRKSKMVNIYTINESQLLDRCIELGVDGIFTDNHQLYTN